MELLATRYKGRLLLQDGLAATEAEFAYGQWLMQFEERRAREGSASRSIRIPMVDGQSEELELRAKALGCSLSVLVAYCLSRAADLVPGDAVDAASFLNRSED
jgi:hypothetical protein